MDKDHGKLPGGEKDYLHQRRVGKVARPSTRTGFQQADRREVSINTGARGEPVQSTKEVVLMSGLKAQVQAHSPFQDLLVCTSSDTSGQEVSQGNLLGQDTCHSQVRQARPPFVWKKPTFLFSLYQERARMQLSSSPWLLREQCDQISDPLL